ncbi:hypothetical protein A3A70_00415 [candidate division WWE3 bacterium RIFCSPLOWO2_01_FULL_42_11]|uniref:Major facilitator superfamily (MFS) profile domain-containing protein n=1 Tax=candidate division WWE3 bacterium RIFCSPLOWO2_01_FULL_42_11 TaxID=1802627 RepID=A0A1F4VM07_UNCKA|nr:MAG: hypothetical protein A3A70_00415 [candidate division WWE3 bacterium RIFCSPLOWO2_01_FULL_42_11]
MNRSLKILLISNAVFAFAGSLFVPLYALFTESVGATPFISGLLYAVHFISATIVGFFIYKLKDGRLPTKSLLELNYLVRGSGWFIIGLFPTLSVLFLVQILVGVSEAFGNAAFNTMFSDHLDKNRHVSDWATWDLWKNPMVALAAILSGLVVTFYSFSILFFLMSAISFASFGIFKLRYQDRSA